MERNWPDIRDAALRVLDRPHERKWTIQGFGMLRTYLSDDERWRLNIWDPVMAAKGVSVIHDHVWDFASWIVCGRLTNRRYTTIPLPDSSLASAFLMSEIQPGIGGGLRGESVQRVVLRPYPLEHYVQSDYYTQLSWELHESVPNPGCVTVNERYMGRQPLAHVLWGETSEWVSAEPRPATADEIDHFVRLATNHMLARNVGAEL